MNSTTDRNLSSFQRDRLARGECIESVYRGRARGYLSTDCGAKLKPVDKGGDGLHCARHISMYAKREQAHQEMLDKQSAHDRSEAHIEDVLKLLGLRRTLRNWEGAVTVNVDALQKRFAEVWENAFDAGSNWAEGLEMGFKDPKPVNPYEVKP
jgi:hypothetical protein